MQGGLGEMYARTLARSRPIYDFIDRNAGFYRCVIDPNYRSRINIAFHIQDASGNARPDLDAKFAEEAKSAGLIGLNGHQWVGGCRITLNNH